MKFKATKEVLTEATKMVDHFPSRGNFVGPVFFTYSGVEVNASINSVFIMLHFSFFKIP